MSTHQNHGRVGVIDGIRTIQELPEPSLIMSNGHRWLPAPPSNTGSLYCVRTQKNAKENSHYYVCSFSHGQFWTMGGQVSHQLVPEIYQFFEWARLF